MSKYKRRIFLGAILCALNLLYVLPVFAMPCAIISRGIENAYGEFPEIDGYVDTALQERINALLRTAANDLRSSTKTNKEANYSYAVIKNETNFLSILLKADAQGVFLGARSVNFDPRTGYLYTLNELFIANEGFFDALEQNLGWRPAEKAPFALSSDGLVFIRETDGKEMTVDFEGLFEWVVIGKSDYYLKGHYLTEAADGKLLRVKKGDLVIVRLATNKSSGYGWQGANNDYEPQFKYLGSSYLLSTAAIGAGGWDMLIFGAVQEGEIVLEMQQKRPWQNQILKIVKIQILCEE